MRGRGGVPVKPSLLGAGLLAAATTAPVVRAADPSEASTSASTESAHSEFVGWLEGGYAGQTLYGVPAAGFDASAALGARKGILEGGVVADFLHANTSYGISSTAATAGMFVQLRVLGRLRLGGGVRIGILDVARATNGGALGSGSGGVYGRLSFDLVPFGTEGAGAVFVFAKGSLDTVDTALYQGVLGLGARF
jgi:hypothetical protein